MSVYLWARCLSTAQSHRSTCLSTPALRVNVPKWNQPHHSFTPPEKLLLLVPLPPKEKASHASEHPTGITDIAIQPGTQVRNLRIILHSPSSQGPTPNYLILPLQCLSSSVLFKLEYDIHGQ